MGAGISEWVSMCVCVGRWVDVGACECVWGYTAVCDMRVCEYVPYSVALTYLSVPGLIMQISNIILL